MNILSIDRADYLGLIMVLKLLKLGHSKINKDRKDFKCLI